MGIGRRRPHPGVMAVMAVMAVMGATGMSLAAEAIRVAGRARDGAELVGTVVPAWDLTDWIGSPPLALEALRGKVVLVRWFTDTDCPYCSLTAPALNQLHRDYASRGLIVIGIYHHKRPEPLDLAAVRGWARDYGFHFPVAVDRDWRTLRRWWLNGHHRDFTSVSFLIDGHGVIRYVHPGGSLALGGADFDALRAELYRILPR